MVDVLREVGKSRATIADLIQQFLAYEAIANELKEATKTAEECYQQCEFWAYYADYDWIVFCQLFGTMMDLPKGLPMFCLDLKQWCYQLGNPELPVQESVNHNALEDALHNRVIWQFLNKIESNRNQYYKIGVS